MSDDHLTDEQLLSVAENGDDVSEDHRGHLDDCTGCRDRLALMRGFLDGIGDEILEARPGCPTPEELAAIPAGGEADHSHVEICSLCQEEIRLHRDLAQDRAMGFNLENIPAPFLGGEMSSVFRSAATVLRLLLTAGAETRALICGAFVSVQVVGSEIVVTVESEPDVGLVLLLTDERIERRVPLVAGELRLPLSSWRWAAITRVHEEEK